jgi:transposase-like protein
MEIITGIERRRRWRLEEKLQIVAEVEQPGASFADAARRHEVSRGLLWNWRARVRRGELRLEPAPMFLPVQITSDMPASIGRPPVARCPTHGSRRATGNYGSALVAHPGEPQGRPNNGSGSQPMV